MILLDKAKVTMQLKCSKERIGLIVGSGGGKNGVPTEPADHVMPFTRGGDDRSFGPNGDEFIKRNDEVVDLSTASAPIPHLNKENSLSMDIDLLPAICVIELSFEESTASNFISPMTTSSPDITKDCKFIFKSTTDNKEGQSIHLDPSAYQLLLKGLLISFYNSHQGSVLSI